MADGQWVVPFAALASLDRDARSRATEPLMLTLIPGPAAQRSAIAAVAVTQQARDGIRRERQVAVQTVEAVAEAAADPNSFTRDSLAQRRALRGIATDELVAQIKAVPVATDNRVVTQAVAALKAAIALSKDEKLPVADEGKYKELVAHLSDAQKKEIFT